jgi:hypothetical protein
MLVLAVLVIERSELALAIGMSLPEHRKQGVRKQVFANDRTRAFRSAHLRARPRAGVTCQRFIRSH